MRFVKQQAISKGMPCMVWLLLCASGRAQDIIPVIESRFDQYAQKTFEEKIFVHTDKNFYLAGEVLWFKLYNTDASSHKPVDLSKVAYVEVLNKQNKPVLQAKIALQNGEGDGSFYLPVTIFSGNYILRAYTNWMKNSGADYFFEKTITIINSQKAWEPVMVKPNAYDIRFFPEGGNLVSNIQSKIACKVTGQNGKGIEYKGTVFDEKNEPVASFSSLYAGITSFDFTPEPGHTYKAMIAVAGENPIQHELPAVYRDGYVMHVGAANGNSIKVDVHTNLSSGGNVYLFVHTRQLTKMVLSAPIQNGHAVFEIDRNKLGDGISHFTVFNGSRQPVCERLYFKYAEQVLQIAIKPDLPEYKERNKVTINISSTDRDLKSRAASMSMAVYRVDSLQGIDEPAIDQYLFLNAELKGTIESPAWYFTNPAARTIAAMDNLMLTHGWRRFRWEEVLQNTAPAFTYVPEFKGHLITGKLSDIRNGKPAAGIQSYLSVPGGRTQFAPSVSNDTGLVKYEMVNMYGSSEIIVQTNQLRDSLYKIDMANPFFEKFADKTLPTLIVPDATVLLRQSVGMQVQNIYSGKQLRQFRAADADTNSFYLKPDGSYFLDNYTRFNTLEEVLREYVNFVDVIKRKGKFHLNMMEAGSQDFFSEDPLILLDGVPVFDVDRFMKYDPHKIRKLEAVNRRYLYHGASFEGILNWTTYEGNLPGFELDPRATVIDYEGLQLEREFYTPVYDSPEKINTHVPDFRNVLYWAPTIHTNETGTQTLSFYTSDLKGKYVMVIQGLTSDGKSGSAVGMFTVK